MTFSKKTFLFPTSLLCCLLTALLAAPAAGTDYVYDDLNRLVRVICDDGALMVYTYDDVGNRTLRTIDYPPGVPTDPTYPDGSVNVPTNPVITWNGSDPDPGAILTYDVYLDTFTPPTTKVASGLTSPSITFENLNCGTTYYWRIVATDQYGISTSTPIWHFSTPSVALAVKNTATGISYAGLQAAYDAASDGNTLLAQSAELTGNFTAQRDITVSIDGGYNCDFSANPYPTTLKGAVAINNGTVTMTNFVISN